MGKVMNKELQLSKLKEHLKKMNIEPDTVDLEALIDEKLRFYENKKNILAQINAKESEAHATKEQEIRENIISVQKNLEMATLDALKNFGTGKPPTKQLQELSDGIKMLVKGHFNGLICVGAGGLGKSFTTLKSLQENNADFEVLNTHISPLSLYEFLHNNNGKIIVLEDSEELLNNKIIVSILRSALWGVMKNDAGEQIRVINYISTAKPAENLPKKFIFTGKIIVLANELPKDKEFEALKTRTLFFDLNFSFEDIKLALINIAQTGYKDIKKDDCLKIVERVNDNLMVFHKNINIRLLEKAFEFYRFDETTWEEKFKGCLETDLLLKKVQELCFGGITPREQAERFMLETGYGKTKYYETKKKLFELMQIEH